MSTLIHALVNLVVLPFQILFHVLSAVLGAMATVFAIPFQLVGTVVGVAFHFLLVGIQLIMLVLMAGIIAAICIGGIWTYNRFSVKEGIQYVNRGADGESEGGRHALSFSFAHPLEAHRTYLTDDPTNAYNGPTIVRTSERNRSGRGESIEGQSSIMESRSMVVVDGDVRSSTTIIRNGKHGSNSVIAIDGEVDSDESLSIDGEHNTGDVIAAEKAVAECVDGECAETTSSANTLASATPAADHERPAWVDEQEDNLHDGTHRVRAECGPCESAQECKRELPLRVREATHKYVLQQVHAWMGSSPFSDWVARQWTTDALRRRKIEPSRTFADLHEVKLDEVASTSHFLYGLLEFDAEFRDRLRRDMQSYVRSARLGSYWCSTILGVAGLAVWFRGSSSTKSLDTAPKRFVARSGAGLIWIAAGVLSMASIAWIPWL